jgi:hypothetical protein
VTTSVPLEDAAAGFATLADRLYSGSSYEGVYDAICRAAVDVVPGCDRACITTMVAGGEPHIEAATDEIARRIDELEWEVREGPCVDAMLSDRFECDGDISQNSAWPRLAERVVAETPVRGMVGYRIRVRERKVGALNVFSDTPGALTLEGAAIGAILASFASVTLGAAAQHEDAGHLRKALSSNREVGKAIGLLMATHDVTDAQAFEMLRTASNELNVRMAQLATEMIGEHNARVEPSPN